ncbi:MAG TPA: DUF305 domain-containing protein [Flavipsychrobacter sp.]|nr:DUF305 domain-containing protein [Flavipsychrobacter sp.]
MKKQFLSILTVTLLAACGETENSNTNTQQVSADTQSLQQPAQQTNPLMTAMHTMMQDMQSMEMSGNMDKDFAMLMKRHHQSAIDMANYELQSGSDTTMRNMAEMIIEKQNKENEQLERIIAATSATKNTDTTFATQSKQMMDNSHAQSMSVSMTGNADRDFAAMMVPHHQSAIDMAQLYLKQGKNAELKRMAQMMVADQQKEIQELNQWLQSR